MTKITSEHLARSAYVYIRQSTPDQLTHNHESLRRQYGLADRARQLGWASVEVIDEDLGRSGDGVSRPGFERLLGAICQGRVGAVLATDASKSRDAERRIVWKEPLYNTAHNILTNPVTAKPVITAQARLKSPPNTPATSV